MLQSKGCLAAARPAFPPIPVAVGAAAAVAPVPAARRRRGLVSVAAVLLLGTMAVALAVALRPDTGDEASAPTTVSETSGSPTTGKATTTTAPTTTTTTAPTTTTTTLPPPTTAGSTSGISSGPGGGGGGSGAGDCDEFAVAFTWTLRGAPYPIGSGASPYAGQTAVASLSGAGLPSSATAIVAADGTTVFGPFAAGPGPWSATLTSPAPDAGPPSISSRATCD